MELEKMITEATVVFGVDEHNNLTCNPAVVHVHRNTQVTFSSASREPFAVQSKGKSPLMKADFRSAGGPVTIQVRENATPGVYSFACAVVAHGQVYLDAPSPAMISDW